MAITKLNSLSIADGSITTSKLADNAVTSAKSSGIGLAWDSTVKTANFTAAAGNGYFINTTSASFVITFPSSATVGEVIEIIDVAGTADTNAIELDPNGLKFNSSATNKALHDERVGASFVYTGATYGWVAVASTEAAAPILIDAPYSVAALIIAGGGGGGGADSNTTCAGGGGA